MVSLERGAPLSSGNKSWPLSGVRGPGGPGHRLDVRPVVVTWCFGVSKKQASGQHWRCVTRRSGTAMRGNGTTFDGTRAWLRWLAMRCQVHEQGDGAGTLRSVKSTWTLGPGSFEELLASQKVSPGK